VTVQGLNFRLGNALKLNAQHMPIQAVPPDGYEIRSILPVINRRREARLFHDDAIIAANRAYNKAYKHIRGPYQGPVGRQPDCRGY